MIYIDRLKKELTSAGCNVRTDMRAPVDFVDQIDGNDVITAKNYMIDAEATYHVMVTKIMKEGNNFSFYDVGIPDEKNSYHLRCAVW